jgi:hypothetical protein
MEKENILSTSKAAIAGKKPEDDIEVGDYGIEKEKTLHLVMRLKGGCWLIVRNQILSIL